MPAGHDRTRILKMSTSPRKGVSVSSYSAWKKVKVSVSNAIVASAMPDGDAALAERSQDDLGKIVEYGNNSEIFIAYKNVVEVWDWFPSPVDDTPCTPRINEAGGTLYLTASKVIVESNLADGAEIVSFKPLNCYRDKSYYVLVVCLKIKNDYYFQLHSMGQAPSGSQHVQQPLILPPSSFGNYPYTIKNTEKFFIICSNEGCLNVFNKTNNANPLSDMTLEAKMFDNKPLFDLSGRWFVYVPKNTEEIVRRLKKVNYKKKHLAPDEQESALVDVTPLKLPKPGPVLNKLVKSLSSTAIDGALKLSEIGTNTFKGYFFNQKTDHSTEHVLSNAINANNASHNIRSSQFVVIIDLLTELPIAIFSPPGSISNMSLSPYDAHLATCNSRGDNVYIWDLSRIPREISLVAKHNRGRTFSSIDQLLWNTGSSAIGLVTRASGSVHWFNNYTDSAVTSDWVLSSLKSKTLCLGPKAAELSFSRHKQLDNSDLTSYNFKEKSLAQSLVKSCILSVSEAADAILVISPHDGSIEWKYSLPEKPIPASLLPDYLADPTARGMVHENLTNYGSDCIVQKDYNQIDPLSEIELETCDQFTPLYKNRHFLFGIYNFSKTAQLRTSFTRSDNLHVTTEPLDSKGRSKVVNITYLNDSNLFRQNYQLFGNGLTVNIFQFGRGTGLPVFVDGDFEEALVDSDESKVSTIDTKNSGPCLKANVSSSHLETYGIKSLRNAMESLLIEPHDDSF